MGIVRWYNNVCHVNNDVYSSYECYTMVGLPKSDVTVCESVAYSLQAPGEPDKVGADTERGALACRNAHGGTYSIKDGKDNRGENGEGRDLIHGERLAGDEQGRRSDHQALDEIFDYAVNNFGNSVVHSYTSI